MSGIWLSLAVSAATVVIVMGVVFAIGVVTHHFSVIDVAWGPGFVAVAWAALLVSDSDSWLRFVVAGLVTVWGLRLGLHIGIRNHGRPEDQRYVQMLAGAGLGTVLRKVHVPQGAVMWVVSFPVQAAMLLPNPVPALAIAGVVVWGIGIAFEAVGDWQLARFSARRTRRDEVLQTGLWRYTRHPNYFGDSCVWWGIFLTVTFAWQGWLTIVSPLLMTYILAAKTGKVLTEKVMQDRPGYADYIATTSGFFPLPPRRSA